MYTSSPQLSSYLYLLSTIIIIVIPPLHYYHHIYTSSQLLSAYLYLISTIIIIFTNKFNANKSDYYYYYHIYTPFSTIIIIFIPPLHYNHHIYISFPPLSSYSSPVPINGPHSMAKGQFMLPVSSFIKDCSNGHLPDSHLCLGQGQAGHHHHQGDDHPHTLSIVSLARHPWPVLSYLCSLCDGWVERSMGGK